MQQNPTYSDQTHPVLVIGGGAIGAALAKSFADKGYEAHLASRKALNLEGIKTHQVTDWSKESLTKLAQSFDSLSGVVVASGLLHDDSQNIAPEKSLDDITSEAMTQVLHVNTVFPALCGQVFLPKLAKDGKSFPYGGLCNLQSSHQTNQAPYKSECLQKFQRGCLVDVPIVPSSFGRGIRQGPSPQAFGV